MAEGKLMTLNMGPHHPSTHGVLRIVLELDGEIIVKATPHVGQLHRGIEKIAENMNYQQVITLTDRLDYTAASLNNFGYCLAVEKLLGIEVPKRAQYIRVIMGELSRLAAHQIWVGTHALDIGAMTLVFYGFRDREMIYDIIEEASGYRLTPSYLRIGGLANDITPDFIKGVREFVKWFPTALAGYHTLLTDNIIWRKRTMDIGTVSAEDAVNFGFTGPSLRGSGIPYDLRKAKPHSSYEDFDFQVPVGDKGDVYDRYLVRMEEMAQSLKIVDQAIENLPEGPVNVDNPWVTNPRLDVVMDDISALIRRFKIQSEGPHDPVGEVYQSIEGSKGELGYYIVGDGNENPYRMKIRSPTFILISALSKILPGHFFSDAVAIVGSIDIVLGEVDR
jgi:NADH-quinone oxidoreductase subunit D